LALIEAVRGQLGITALGLSDAEILVALNRAQWDFAWRLPDAAIPALCRTETGQMEDSRITPPDDFWRDRALLIGDSQVQAKRWPVAELGTITGAQPSRENPIYYLWAHGSQPFSGVLRIYVEIGDVLATDPYVLHYVGQPGTLALTSDPDWSDALAELAVSYAATECLGMRSQFVEQTRLAGEYLLHCRKLASRFGATVFDAVAGEAG